MRVTAPLASARIGDVEIFGVQRVVELEALDFNPRCLPDQHQDSSANTTQAVAPSAINAIQSRTAIVVPCKDEPLDHIRGVWAAIPATSLIILVSGSEPHNYTIERDALSHFCHTTGRCGMSVQQQDPRVADALRAAGMRELLADDGAGLVHRGKGEGLIIGIALAATAKGPEPANHSANERCRSNDVLVADMRCDSSCPRSTSRATRHCPCNTSTNGGALHSCSERAAQQQCANDGHAGGTPGYYRYIGFVDADNFVPGSVQEYCRAFSAGLHLAQAEDAMVRIKWSSKPKLNNGKLQFKPSGRSSEIVNRWLNQLLMNMDACIDSGYVQGRDEATDLICTGNAGEHAMTISLALKLRVASGYAIEPFHFLDILERFTGDSQDSTAMASEHTEQPSKSLTVAATSFDDEMPVSPVSMSPVDSPLRTPLDGSPTLSACEEYTQPTSPSIISTSLDKIPAVKALPPPLNSLPSYRAALAQADSDLTPPESPTSLASPAKVQILQFRTINPHFHDNKGDGHVVRMWKQGLSAIYHSPVVFGLTQFREDLRLATFGTGENEGQGLPTPPFSNSASVATSPSLSVDDSTEDAPGIAADGWQPAKCRIYPATGSMDLKQLRDRLEKEEEGSFWWSGRAGQGSKDATMLHDTPTPGLGFDDVAVLGLGPVSRERRPEGDVDGFKACVDETH